MPRSIGVAFLTFFVLLSACAVVMPLSPLNADCQTFACAFKPLRVPIGTFFYYPVDGLYEDERGALTKLGEIVKNEFSSVFVSIDWGAVERQRGRYDFTVVDQQIALARKFGLKSMISHALIFTEEQAQELLPEWLRAERDPNRIKEDFRRYIRTVMRRYKGTITHYIIANEAYHTDDSWRAKLGNYLSFVYRVARETDPTATLMYNEAFVENEEGYYSENREAANQVLRELTSQGLLDMFCDQGHLYADQHLNVPEFRAYLQDVQKKYKIRTCVSELDINIKNVAGTLERKFQVQADLAYRFVTAALQARVSLLHIWDVDDGNANRDDAMGGPGRYPAFWTENFIRKPSHKAVVRAAKEARR